jgi:hypothetical protein
MNYNILNDYIIKVPYNNPYNKPKLSEVRVIMSNNNIINNNKLLIPLVNTSLSITGQTPSILRAKKSVASFKVRKGSPIGLLTTLTPQKGFGLSRVRLNNYMRLINTLYLPKISTTTPSVYKLNNKLAISNLGNSTLTIGIHNYSLFSYISPLPLESLQVSYNLSKLETSNLTGGYTQLTHKYKLPIQYKLLPKASGRPDLHNLTKFIHTYYFTSLYMPY